jgi:hypothetical protein
MLPAFTFGQAKSEQEEKIEGYFYHKRLVGPKYSKSVVLEIMVDKYDNFMAVTYRAEKATHTHLNIYKLYSWEEVLSLTLSDKRVELYNSTFDPDGNFFYANTDIYRNKFKKINIKTKQIEEVNCDVTPNGCLKIEPKQYSTEAYTWNKNYYLYRPVRFQNSVLVMKDRSVVDAERLRNPNFLLEEEKKLEEELNKTDPEETKNEVVVTTPEPPQKTTPPTVVKEPVKEQPKVRKTHTTFIDFMLTKEQINSLERYKYCKMANYEIIINNWLAATFEFTDKTKSITISESDFNALKSKGTVTNDAVRLNIPAELVGQ